MQTMKVPRNQNLWGLAVLSIMTILGIVATMLYVSPPGNKIITFDTDDASSITPGISVRIAGVTVGTVKDLAIEPQQVRVRASIDSTKFVGDQSQVQVRMLTVVGGYFVNIDSLGDQPLGDRAIPRDRVELPYNLMRTLVNATRLTDSVATAPIKQSLNELQQGMAGQNVEALSSIINASRMFVETLDRQRGQVSSVLNLSDEYIAELSHYREQFTALIQKIAVLEQTLVLYGEGASAAALGLGKIMQGIGPLGGFYENHRDEFLAKFTHWQQIVRSWADRSGLVVRILRRTRDRMQRTLDAQNAPPEFLATDLCIPTPLSAC